jgi:imidazolonepropionase-like amidohydrolase
MAKAVGQTLGRDPYKTAIRTGVCSTKRDSYNNSHEEDHSVRGLVLLSILLSPLGWAAPLVIRGVTVIDATGRPPQAGMTVVMEEDRIAAIGPSTKQGIPAGSQVIDGKGKFLIPGLWDMHAHEFASLKEDVTWSYPVYLANGVLGVREMWGPEDANAWRAVHARYGKPSPSVYIASPIIDGQRPPDGTVHVADASQARAAVNRYKANGADFIKVYTLLSRDAYFAIADEAHKLAIPFVGHVPDAITVEEASDAGQKSMEHLIGVPLGASSDEAALFREKPVNGTFGDYDNTGGDYRRYLHAYATYDESKAAALYARFIKNGTWQCPTLVEERSWAHLDDDKFKHEEWLKYMPLEARSWWTGLSRGMATADWDNAHRLLPLELKFVGQMYSAGVGILAGTDALGGPYLFPGFSLHEELALLVEADLTPLAALQAATINAARFMGQSDLRGTIEVGKIADLVLLDRNPLADIHNSTSIRAVILGGKFMSRASLDAMLAEVEALAAAPTPTKK